VAKRAKLLPVCTYKVPAHCHKIQSIFRFERIFARELKTSLRPVVAKTGVTLHVSYPLKFCPFCNLPLLISCGGFLGIAKQSAEAPFLKMPVVGQAPVKPSRRIVTIEIQSTIL
jgi:hypothetical protein